MRTFVQETHFPGRCRGFNVVSFSRRKGGGGGDEKRILASNSAGVVYRAVYAIEVARPSRCERGKRQH